MTTSHISPIELCPFHFEKFDALNRKVGSIGETLLLSKIMFHLQGSQITKNGVRCIVRSREQLASWFGFSLRKTDALLSSLEHKGYLTRQHGLWHGTKRLFLSTKNIDRFVPINMILLNVLMEITGSLDAALVYARIAFIHTKASHSDKEALWSYLKKKVLTSYLGFSIRKLDGLVCILVKKGLLLKKNLVSCGKRQTHFHIPLSSLKVLKERFLAALHKKRQGRTQKVKIVESSVCSDKSPSCKICRLQPAKFATSIKVRTTTKKTNNNTTESLSNKQDSILSVIPETSDINFSQRKLAYLQGALTNLIHRDGISVSNPKELLAQMKYALAQQINKFNLPFSHGINRLCAIVRSGNWSTPYGFYSYSPEGRALKAGSRSQEKQWQEQKRQECQTGGFAALAAACRVDDQVNTAAGTRVENRIMPYLPEPAMTSADRILIDGQLADASAVNQPQQRQLHSRLEVIFDTISRYQKRMASMAIGEQSIIAGLIDRLRAEAQEIQSIRL